MNNIVSERSNGMTANYHTHTRRCGHAVGEDRAYVEQAIAAGLEVLGFSDHSPFVYPNGYVSGIRMSPAELDGYFSSLTSLKQEYAGDIRIYIGFEAEYIPELMEAQDRLLSDYPVDYMILGQHSIAREDISPYTGSPTSDVQLLHRYTDLVIEGMESGRYKYLAHPDLVNYIGDTAELDSAYDRICRYLSEKDSPVEINLLGLHGGRNYPSGRFLKKAGEYGCKAIIGFDAHAPEFLCERKLAEQGAALAEEYGLTVIHRIPGLE
jgi:histidinol-phosphatase (PHP family)